MQLKKLNKKKNKIKMVVFGDYGSRKSSCVSDFALMKREDGKPMRVLYFDFETESLSGFNTDRLIENGVNMDNFLLVEPSGIEEVMDTLKKVELREPFYELDEDGDETDVIIKDADGETFYPDAIVIDSVSALVQDIKSVYREISKIRARVRNEDKDISSSKKLVSQETADLELGDYGKIKGIGEKFVSQLIRKIDTHAGIIVRGKQEKKNVKTPKGIEVISTGREIVDTWDFLKYDGNIVMHLKKEEDDFGNTKRVIGVIDSKDRTGTFSQGQILENPSVLLWQSVIEKNKDRLDNTDYQKRLSDSEKVKKTILQTKKKIENTKVSFEDRMVAIKTSFQKLTPNDKKILAGDLKKMGISPKDFIEGKCSEEQTQLGYKIIVSLEKDLK